MVVRHQNNKKHKGEEINEQGGFYRDNQVSSPECPEGEKPHTDWF